MPCRLVFLLDVDNTLLDNDALRTGLNRLLDDLATPAGRHAFWEVYEEVRAESGLIHMPTILERAALRHHGLDHPGLAAALYGFDFGTYRFPAALAVIRHLASLGTVAITSDGDEHYQVAKIRGAGLWDAVQGRAWIVPRKQDHYPAIAAAHPADRYVVVDDKPAILADARAWFGPRAYTVWMRYGRYAQPGQEPVAADRVITDVGELLALGAADFCGEPPLTP